MTDHPQPQTDPTKLGQRSWRLIGAGAVFFAYVVAGSLALYFQGMRSRDAKGGLFDITHGFGPFIECLATRGTYGPSIDRGLGDVPLELTCFRMPLIPYFMAGIAKIKNSMLLGLLLKNLVFGLPLFIGGCILVRRLNRVPGCILLLAAAFAMSFLYLVICTLMPDFEEGYLTGPMFLVVVCLLDLAHRRSTDAGSAARRIGGLIPLAVLNALLYLTKSSALPAAIVISLLYAYVTWSRRVLLLFAGCVAAAVLFWCAHNWATSGQFRPWATSNAEDLYKGNNALTARYYPDYQLDILMARKLLISPRDIRGEWNWFDYNRQQAYEFIRTHPAEMARLFLRKCYVYFLAVERIPRFNHLTTNPQPEKRWHAPINWAAMLVFRILMLGGLLTALHDVLRGFLRRHEPGSNRSAAGLCYLLFILAYAVPCLIGFVYQRHVMPIVLPTLAYCLWLAQDRWSRCDASEHPPRPQSPRAPRYTTP